MKPIYFITGTDTGAGKTVLTSLLARFLSDRNANVAALKPLCSGGREDARALQAALEGTLSLDEINPWHFRTAVAPALAARREGSSVTLKAVLAHLRRIRGAFDVTLVEGAGGLLSPLGQDFNSRDLLVALRARPLIVAPNRLGVVNHLLLTLEALPKKSRAGARVVLMTPARPDVATASNARLLAPFFPPEKVHTLPWLGRKFSVAEVVKLASVRRTLARICAD